jgi:hypothetical protein
MRHDIHNCLPEEWYDIPAPKKTGVYCIEFTNVAERPPQENMFSFAVKVTDAVIETADEHIDADPQSVSESLP